MTTPLEELQDQIEQAAPAPHAPSAHASPTRRPAARMITRSRMRAYIVLAYFTGMVSCVTVGASWWRMVGTDEPLPARASLPSMPTVPSRTPNVAQLRRCPIEIKDDGFFVFTNMSDRTITITKISLNRQYSVILPFNYQDGTVQTGTLAVGEIIHLPPFKLIDSAGSPFRSGFMTPVTWRIDTSAGDWRIDWK